MKIDRIKEKISNLKDSRDFYKCIHKNDLELLEELEEVINFIHCCTELKTLKQGEKLILDNKFDVQVVAPSEKNVLIKYKETDRIVWVNEQRLKRK